MRNFVPRPVPTTHLAQALIRDNWTCVATGIIDRSAPVDPLPQFAIHTECVHIIPEATFFGVNTKSERNSKVCGCTHLMLILC